MIATEQSTRRSLGQEIWRARRRVKREARQKQLEQACESKRSPQQNLRSVHFNWKKAFGKDGNAADQLSAYFSEIYELEGPEKIEEDIERAKHVAAWRARLEHGATPLSIGRAAVEKAIAKLKNGKNSSDGLTAEILKKLDPQN